MQSLATLLVLTVAIAACGGGDAEDSGPPLTREEFIAQADEICAQGRAAIQAAATKRFGAMGPTPAERVEFMRTVVADSFEQQLRSIEELTPPEVDQARVEAFLGALEELIDEARNDPEALFTAQQIPEAARLAQEFGLTGCGS